MLESEDPHFNLTLKALSITLIAKHFYIFQSTNKIDPGGFLKSFVCKTPQKNPKKKAFYRKPACLEVLCYGQVSHLISA